LATVRRGGSSIRVRPRPLRVLHVAPTVSTTDGTSVAVLAMIEALQEHADIDVQLLVGKYRGVDLHPALANRRSVAVLPVLQPLGGRLGYTVGYPRNFSKTLADLACGADLVHLHGLWLYPTLLGCPILRRIRKPYVVSLHGSLMIDALRRSRLKKRIAYALFERRNIESAKALVTTSAAELDQLRHRGLSTPRSLIPLAVDPEALQNDFTGELLAIEEFNDNHENVKIAQIRGLRQSRSIPAAWNEGMYALHRFDHPQYNTHISGAESHVRPL